MRSPRRPLTLAALALAATGALSLTACTTTVHATVDAAGITQQVAEAARTGGAHAPSHTPSQTPSTPSAPTTAQGSPAHDTPADDSTGSASGENLPEPGYGVHGDEGLFQAEAGWYGYATLSLVGASADDQVWPDEIVPVLEQLRNAPTAHEDASPDLVSAASDLSYATDEVITEITSGADAAQAMAELDDPFTTFANGCIAAGIQV